MQKTFVRHGSGRIRFRRFSAVALVLVLAYSVTPAEAEARGGSIRSREAKAAAAAKKSAKKSVKNSDKATSAKSAKSAASKIPKKKAAPARKARSGKIDLTPDFNPSKHASNEEAMKNTKFKMPEKPSVISVGMTCTDTSGRLLSQGDAGYEGCLSNSQSGNPERRTNSGPTATVPVLGR